MYRCSQLCKSSTCFFIKKIKLLISLFKGYSIKEKEGPEKNSFFCSSQGWDKPKSRTRDSIQVFTWVAGPSTWAILHCFPKSICRKLDGRHYNQNLSQPLDMRYQCSKGDTTSCATIPALTMLWKWRNPSYTLWLEIHPKFRYCHQRLWNKFTVIKSFVVPKALKTNSLPWWPIASIFLPTKISAA